MNLVTLLEERSAEDSDRLALVEGHDEKRRSLTFDQLDRRVRARAASLREQGVRPGEAVLFLHPVSIEFYISLLGCLRIGAVAVVVDPGAGLAGLRHAIRRLAPTAWTGHGKGRIAAAFLPRLWGRKRLRSRPSRFSRKADGEEADAPAAVEPETPALVTFTSGSTGAPKAAVRSHGFLLAQNRTLGKAITLEAGEVDLVTLPVFALANLAHGVTSILAAADSNASREAHAIACQLERERVTRCAAAPAFFSRTLDAGVDWSRCDKLFTGGGPVFPPLLDRLARAAHAARVCAVYGSTEAEPIAHAESGAFTEEVRDRMAGGAGLFAGRPVAEIDLAILPGTQGRTIAPLDAASFSRLQAAPREAGEIVVSGEHVLSGYLDGIGEEETKFRVVGRVWHRTGDEGYIDEDGRLWLLGRSRAVIRNGRSTPAYPFAVETALSSDEAIARSAVVGIEGRAVLAVEWAPPADPEARPRLEASAARFGIDRVEEFDSLPVDRRHRSKIDHPELERLLRRRLL